VAAEKRKLPARKKRPVWLAADGKVFDQTRTYYFFDEQGKQVRTSSGLRANEKGFLDSFGLSVVRIDKLRNSEGGAAKDGIAFYQKVKQIKGETTDVTTYLNEDSYLPKQESDSVN